MRSRAQRTAVRPVSLFRLSALGLASLCTAAALGGGASARPGGVVATSPAGVQWYLDTDRAWSYWAVRPRLTPVTVAVIDTGIDAGNPAFRGRIVGGRSFAGTRWQTDLCGHGTFVSGLIAADPADAVGVAGVAFNARLLVASVADRNCDVVPSAEARAIRWAADRGARVINLSLGGTRDPVDAQFDRYQPAELEAVEYAFERGALVVAASGNGQESPSMPWPFANYPAALPHVVGVGAIRQDGSVPDFSNRDRRYVDLVAPGVGIVSTIPRSLVDTSLPGCAARPPVSTCGPPVFRDGAGTSFAAPQVSAAAALLLGVRPGLSPGQLAWLLERSALDESAATGCARCPVGRDAFSGFGRLDVAVALRLLGDGSRLPAVDPFEPNDLGGDLAAAIAPPTRLSASVDPWDDPVDIYTVQVAADERLTVHMTAAVGAAVRLELWLPGTAPTATVRVAQAQPAITRSLVAGNAELSFTATAVQTVEIEVSQPASATAPVSYQLAVARAAAPSGP